MKKSKFLLMCLMLLFLSALAYAGFESNIKVTKHNLSKNGSAGYKSTTVDEICVFCHTPHNAAGWPLWNRNNVSSTYTIYTSKTFNNAILGETISLDNYSKLCLTCHESLNNIATLGPIRAQYQKAIGVNNVKSFASSNTAELDKTMLGTDLMNDHPVGFNYAKAATIYPLHTKSNVVNALGYSGVDSKVFPDGKMSCVSCHDVHGRLDGSNNVIPVLLKRSNSSSMLCLSCHKK